MKHRTSQATVRGNRSTERLAWSIAELCKAYGMSRAFWTREMQRGRIRARRFGRKILVFNADLENYLGSVETIGPPVKNL